MARRFLTVLAMLAALPLAARAQYATATYNEASGPIRSVTFYYTSTNATFTNANWAGGSSKYLNGRLVRFYMPATCSATGATFGVTLKDSLGVDLLMGKGTVTSGALFNVHLCGATFTNSWPPVWQGPLTLAVTNMGSATTTNSGSGTAYYEGL